MICLTLKPCRKKKSIYIWQHVDFLYLPCRQGQSARWEQRQSATYKEGVKCPGNWMSHCPRKPLKSVFFVTSYWCPRAGGMRSAKELCCSDSCTTVVQQSTNTLLYSSGASALVFICQTTFYYSPLHYNTNICPSYIFKTHLVFS